MRTRFTADPHAPAAARKFVRRRLQTALDPGQGHVREDLELIVSELVTNSVRAGARVVELELRVAPERVEVAVKDDAGGWPTPRSVGPDSLGGRGLEIVARLADDWRAVPDPPGKRVIAVRRRQYA
jgi:anti-sigma regulatory factor (Ser/Thr protein kinase)